MAASVSLEGGGQFQSFLSEEGGEVDWEFDKFDDGSHKLVGKITLEKYGVFLREYSAQLKSIVEAVDETMGGDAWDAAADPIQLQCVPLEAASLRDMLQSDGETLNRVVLVLAILIKEISSLKSEAETRFYDALLFYGEGIPTASSTAASGVDNQMAIAKFLPLLQDLAVFVTRCHEVAKNVVCQFASLYKPQPKGGAGRQHVLDVSHVHFQVMVEKLGELLTILITLDEIIDAQTTLQEHWTLFKRMIKSVSMDARKFAASDEDLKHFEKVLMMLEGRLLDGVIYQNCVEQVFDDALETPLNKNAVVNAEFYHCIKTAMAQFEAKLSSSSSSSSSSKEIVGICGLFVLHFQIFRNLDKKFFKQLWDSHKRTVGVSLWGNVFFLPNEFLLAKLPQFHSVVDKKSKSQLIATRDAFVRDKNANLEKETQALHFQISSWMIHMERRLGSSSDLKSDMPLIDQLEERSQLLISGLRHAQSLSSSISTTLNVCAILSKPMAKAAVLSLCRSIELLKAIHFTFHRHSLNISKSVNHMILHSTLKGAAILEKCQLRAKAEKRSTRRHDEILAAFQILESCVKDGVKGTKDRRAVTDLALCIVRNTKHVKDDEFSSLTTTLRQIALVSTIFSGVRRACDCAFFYWHRAVIPVYLTDVFKSGIEGNGSADAYRIRFFFAAMKDCLEPMAKVTHLESHLMMRTAFEDEVKKMVKENLLDPICQHVETDLRLSIHSHLQLDDRNPFRVGLSDLAPFIQMKPIKFNDSSIDVKAYVEQYLDKTFYNLTTVALHDWKTYGDMKHLALNKYGLELIDADLPSQTLEQGLDVLEIMRNIHVFVSKYLYNLNNQIFVEKSSNNKYLNTINIRHVANSIRTHGIGIMNTTVNFTFQFLGKKFKIFSEFLFDEHIKSKLMKDIRFFRDNHAKSDQKYPFDRAERFNRAIRKLGVMEDGSSYLDKFREVVTEIGNAMGYIRMIRSGGLHCVANAIQFVPNDTEGGLDETGTEGTGYFERLVSSISLSAETQKAASNLDAVVDNLVRNFAEGTEYFKMLVNVFQTSMKNHGHLRHFWIIVPPLMMNFIEHILAAKEKLTKKNKVGAAFTDDGFVMGVAFILKLLDQYLDFDSLHWFQSVSDHYETEKQKVGEQKSKLASAGKSDERLQQSMNLTVKRLETYRREFQLLEYSLSSARIFFRADMTAAEESEDKKETPEEVKQH